VSTSSDLLCPLTRAEFPTPARPFRAYAAGLAEPATAASCRIARAIRQDESAGLGL